MRTSLTIATLIASGGLLLGGCDPAAKTFGKTYDECLLKNAAQATANEICARHFERLRTLDEQDGDMLTADGEIVGQGADEKIVVNIKNNSSDKIAASYSVTAAFWANDSLIPTTKFQRTIGPVQYGLPHTTVNHRELISPGQTITLELPVPPGTLFTNAFTVDVTVRQVVPMRGD